MCAKKKSISSKVWKLAGEQVPTALLTMAERETVADEFSVFRKFRSGEDHGIECVTQAAARTHESAAAAVSGFLCRHYEGRFKRDTVIKVISVSAAIPANWAERIARREDFLMGAALWLLDYLEDACEDPDEYLTLLPVEPDSDLEYYMPCAEDLEHSRETVLRMMTVLEGREKAWRREFRALLSMIDADTAASLRTVFKAALLDYLDRAIEVYQRLKPFPKEPPSFLTSSTVSFDTPPLMDPREEKPEIFFLHMAPKWVALSQPDLEKELHSRKAAELLAGFGIDAPYELCAAYLLLEREGDALANLNGLTSVILISATHHLPWAHDDFGARAGLFQSGAPDYRLRYEYSAEPDEDDEGPLEVGSRLSESQLFLIATGMVLPRRRAPSDKLIRWFIRQGLEERRARELAWAAFIAYYTENGEYGWREIDLFDGGEAEDEDTLPQEDPTEPSEVLSDAPQGEETQARLVDLTRQVKDLRNALHDAERTGSRLKEQLREAEHRGEADRAELAQLRETLYQLKAGEDSEAGDGDSLVELPWQVKRRVVVFGGHDSWRKAVKPLLPGARFYDREVLPDLNAIRGADVVWLQVNALSHKYYYRVVDAARKHEIPVRYFGSASAKKCAVQLALDELAAEQNEI